MIQSPSGFLYALVELMKTNWSARPRKSRRSRSMSSAVNAIQSTTTSNRWPASARLVAASPAGASSRRSATSEVAPRARSGSLHRFRRNSSTPRSTAKRVQALLIRPVPPTNRTFMDGLLYERKRVSRIASREPHARVDRGSAGAERPGPSACRGRIEMSMDRRSRRLVDAYSFGVRMRALPGSFRRLHLGMAGQGYGRLHHWRTEHICLGRAQLARAREDARLLRRRVRMDDEDQSHG